MNSQYFEGYKQMFYSRLAEGKKPLAVSGFTRRQITGNARKWYARYSKSLKNTLIRNGWVPCESVKGGQAFEPPKNKNAT